MKLKDIFLFLLTLISVVIIAKVYLFGPSFEGLNSSGELLLALLISVISWWILSEKPMHVVGMLGLCFSVFLGLCSFSEAFQFLANPLIFLFLGGFFFSIVIQKLYIDEKIIQLALNIPMIAKDKRLIFISLIILTAFFSFWFSNTATVAIILPVILKLINSTEELSSEQKAILLMSIAFSAAIGGIISPVGTSVNIITVALLQEKASIYLSFLEWIKHTYSFTLLSLLILCVSVFYSIRDLKGPLQIKTHEKHSMSSEEIIFYILFSCIVVLWILPSFSTYLPYKNFIETVLTPSFVIFFMSLLLFFIPSKKFGVLLSWKDTKSIDYSSLFLFSSGLGLGYLIQKTQLANFIGVSLFSSVVDKPQIFTCIAVLFTLILTEFVSNAVCISLILPIVLGFALDSSIDPLKVSILLAITSSLCFLFPMGTPPNSLVYSTGYISKKQFFIFGFYFKVMMTILVGVYAIF